MQNIKNIFIRVSVALTVTMLSVACLSEKEAMPDSLQSVMVQVNVSVGQMTKAEVETPSETELPQVAMSSVSTARFAKAVKREITLGRAFVPVAPNNGGMANAVPQPYTRPQIAIK